jgi:hypothetical protein
MCLCVHVQALRCTHSGQELTAEEAKWDFMLESPNQWQLVATMFADPERLKQFLARKCKQADIAYPGSTLYTSYIQVEPTPGEEFTVSV